MPLPLVAHADWSVSPAKRCMCVATPAGSGWHVGLEKADHLSSLLERLQSRAKGAPVAIGFDAPIGMPLAFRNRHVDFPSFLRAMAPDAAFFQVAGAAKEIGPDRPFYPARSVAGSRRKDLLDRLGLAEAGQLLRECERRIGSQNAASPMFWTLGANQVGKGAICLWRDLLLPAMHGEHPPSIWPFDGDLAALLRPGRTTIAETYPASAARQMELGFRGSKRRQSDRRAVADSLAGRMAETGAEPDPALASQIADGFGTGNDGEDRFDSLVGLIRMLQIIRNPALDHLPPLEIRRWEGWILGRPLSIA